jgi:hypothetical protein
MASSGQPDTHRRELADLECIIERVLASLDGGDAAKARLAVSMFISHIEVQSGKPPYVRVYYTFPHPDSVGGQGLNLMPPRGIEPLFQP